MVKLLKIGTMVLLYEKNPDELALCSAKELSMRLYEITGISTSTVKTGGKAYQYGMIAMKFHQEARASSLLTPKKGAWKANEDYRPVIEMNHSQINCLVEGDGFKMSEDGKIILVK